MTTTEGFIGSFENYTTAKPIILTCATYNFTQIQTQRAMSFR